MFRPGKVDFHVDDHTFRVDEQDGRDSLDAVEFLGDRLPVEEDSVFQLAFFHEAGDVVFRLVPGIDAEDDESLAAILLGQATQVRSLRTAGRSAKRPKREHNGFAPELA